MTQLDKMRRSRRNEAPYLCCIDRICQGFALVERLEESIKALGQFNDCLSRVDMGNEYIHRLGQSWLEALGPLYLHRLGPSALFLFAVLRS